MVLKAFIYFYLLNRKTHITALWRSTFESKMFEYNKFYLEYYYFQESPFLIVFSGQETEPLRLSVQTNSP